MKYAVTIQHPGHVHFFKHAVHELTQESHDLRVFCKDRGVIRELLEHNGIEYEVLAGGRDGRAGMAKNQAGYELRLLSRALRYRPDVMTAVGGTAVAHVASLVGARSVVFTDTEHAPTNPITFPFADEVWTPECYHGDPGTRHVEYPGYHELAYLHPNRFDPDPAVLADAGLDPNERYVVLRLGAWDAAHDAGQGGLNDPEDAVEDLEATGVRVLVTSETALDGPLADRHVEVDPHRIHDLLAFADLFLGEGATMAVESAVLGTPAVYVNTLRMGYTDEIEARYGLLYNCQGAYRHRNALETAVGILEGEMGRDWDARREQLLADKRDTTEVVLGALRDETLQHASSRRATRDPGRDVAIPTTDD